ncbi:site-specific DNA-methyltransferase [Nonomuraea turkmeniaca]|uniref:Methyltransferase n=1 Tax=Nonomuraea turkmeniaca TaxID=103838 RepID=A0A5S4FLT8_9ACTN|nr:site-specific DNA-methyltransferase [Nonomuraea turkmeniaca]TMR10099.1 site-specific DNA-methyltransferase [Nonomuraea turkmeniaca]
MLPAPFYEDDLVHLYQGDALDILAELGPGDADHVVTDPPYQTTGTSWATKASSWADTMNTAHWFTTWYQHVARILPDHGSFWSCCNWRTLPIVQRAAHDARLDITSVAVWHKDAIRTGSPRGLRADHELIAVMAKAAFRIADRSAGDVWTIKTGTRKPHGHPAEKPVALPARILELIQATPGQIILDPFAGSGTTAEAAKRRGHKVIAIEADAAWCQTIATRLAAVPSPADDGEPL